MALEVSPSVVQRPAIYKYRDYRHFLADSYAFKKSQRAGFSYRRFSQLARLKSPNYIQLVIQGKRNLSETAAAQIAKALNLISDERSHFLSLVALENAKTEESRVKIQSALLRQKKRFVTKEIPRARAIVLSEWYHLLVRELVALEDFEPSGRWVSQKLRGLVTPEAAEKSIALLIKGGFLKQSGRRLMMADPVIDTGEIFGETQVLDVHRGVLEAWIKLIPNIDRDQRELGLINIPIASDKLPELKKRIRNFQDEIIGWLESEEKPDRVVQLGTYLIPITGGSPSK